MSTKPNMKKQRQVRQGDVLLTEVSNIKVPTHAKRVNGAITVAKGEATGHHHTIMADADYWEEDGDQMVALLSPAPLTHQEHGLIKLRKQSHRVRIQSEYAPEEIRSVQD
jgi:hypothetical protein